MYKLAPEDMRIINELKDSLETVCAKMNMLQEHGILVRFNFAPGPDGKQVVGLFEVLAPIDLSKTSS